METFINATRKVGVDVQVLKGLDELVSHVVEWTNGSLLVLPINQ